MKKNIYIFIISGFLLSFQMAWSNPIDSMLSVLETDINDSLKGVLYEDIALHYKYTKIDSFIDYTRKSLAAFTKSDYQRGILRAMTLLGNGHAIKNNIDSANHYLSKAQDQVDDKDYESRMLLYFNYGFLHHNNGLSYKEAISNYQKSIDFATLLKDSTRLAICHYNIADIFGQNGMAEKALPHNRKALSFAKNTELKALRSIVLNGMGLYYLDQEKHDSSMYYFKLTIEATNLQYDYNAAFYAYTGLLGSYLGLEQYDKSYHNSIQANHYAKLMEVDYELAMSYYNLSVSSLMSDRKKESIRYWNTFINMIDTIDNDYLSEKAYQLKIKYLIKKKEYQEGYELMEKYTTLKDSVFSKESRSIIAELETKYETTQKEAEIQKQDLIISKQQTERNSILGGTALLFSLVSLFMWNLIQRSRKNKLLSSQQSEIQEQKIAQLEKEKTILSMTSMIEGQEAERKRIAQDLHDGLGGLLATVKTKFGTIQHQIEALESINVYQEANTMLDQACSEVRQIAHNMMPDSLIKLGLVEAVRDLTDHISDTEIKVINLGMHPLEETTQVMLYRVIQEFLNNTRKHAQASQVIIQFSSNKLYNMIYLEDDGQGFDKYDTLDKNGIGLKGMESRIKFINGTIDIDSVIGVGTTISIQIPR